MRSIKKLVLSLVLVLTIGTMIVGCSSKNEGNVSEEKSKEAPAEVVEDEGVIRVGTSGKYYPFTFMDGEELAGFEIDIWEEIGRRINKKIEWQKGTFEGLFGMVDTGKIDTAAHQISITPSREEKYVFSEIYASNPYKICVAEDNDSVTKIEDLYGKKVGVNPTSYEREFLDKLDPEEKIERVFYDTSAEFIRDVDLGRIDAALHTVANFNEVKEKGDYKIKLVGDIIFEEDNAYPFAKDVDEELLEKVNKAIKEMHEDGTLTDLSNKWFDVDITE